MTMLDLRDGRISHQSTVQAWDEPAAPRPETGDFARAEETEVLDRARTEALRVGGHTAVRMTLRPGWRWTVDMAESRGTAKCMANHRAYVVSGALRWQMDDGTEGEVRAGQVVCLPPNHDAWCSATSPSPWSTGRWPRADRRGGPTRPGPWRVGRARSGAGAGAGPVPAPTGPGTEGPAVSGPSFGHASHCLSEKPRRSRILGRIPLVDPIAGAYQWC
ncbi:hypothetical protein HFP72_33265 [Nocardiopsis sp. ARC36]